MTYWAKEAKRLAKEKAFVVVVDYFDIAGLPVYAVRRVKGALGIKKGKHSFWGVSFDEPLTDGVTVVAYSYILSWTTSSGVDFERFLNDHLRWAVDKLPRR